MYIEKDIQTRIFDLYKCPCTLIHKKIDKDVFNVITKVLTHHFVEFFYDYELRV